MSNRSFVHVKGTTFINPDHVVAVRFSWNNEEEVTVEFDYTNEVNDYELKKWDVPFEKAKEIEHLLATARQDTCPI